VSRAGTLSPLSGHPGALQAPDPNRAAEDAVIELFAPLVAATKDRDLRDADAVRDQARLWLRLLEDIPRDVLGEAVADLARSVVFWPRPVEVRKACAAVVERRRLAVARRAQAARATCDRGCSAEGWIEVPGPGGIPHMARCECRKAAERVLAEQPAALALPAATTEGEATE